MTTRSLAWWHQWVEFATLLVVLLGVPAFFYERWSAGKDARIEHTLDYIEQFQDGRIGQARSDLTLAWSDYGPEIQALNAAGGVDRGILERWVSTTVAASVERSPQDNLRSALFVMADFFDQLSLCIDARICDEQTAQRYFAAEASQFMCLYGGEVQSMRAQLSLGSFGTGLQSLAERSDVGIKCR